IKRVADPIEFATKYEQAGADVLFMLDIDGKDREKFLQIVQKVANTIHIPLYVGGGIRTIADMKSTLKNGADKVAITSAAIDNRDLLKEANTAIESDALILSIDAKRFLLVLGMHSLQEEELILVLMRLIGPNSEKQKVPQKSC